MRWSNATLSGSGGCSIPAARSLTEQTFPVRYAAPRDVFTILDRPDGLQELDFVARKMATTRNAWAACPSTTRASATHQPNFGKLTLKAYIRRARSSASRW